MKGLRALQAWGDVWRDHSRGGAASPDRLNGLPAPVVSILAAIIARRRRKLGLYDELTLHLYRLCWEHAGSPRALCAYVGFRRDLGLVADNECCGYLVRALPRVRGRLRQRMSMLLAEAAAAGGAPSDQAANQPLAVQQKIFARQDEWRREFEHLLLGCADQGLGLLCVVGNGPVLEGKGLGAIIDQHALVLRFNRFASSLTALQDIGCRTDVWISAPDYSGPAPPAAGWVILSGPDMRWRLRNWTRFVEPVRRGQRVIAVPIAVWRDLVALLQAPPSAGLLMLAWLRGVRDGWDGITIAGFGTGSAGRYHHALPGHRAASRHNWDGERLLLSEWERAGLRRLDAPDGGHDLQSHHRADGG